MGDAKDMEDIVQYIEYDQLGYSENAIMENNHDRNRQVELIFSNGVLTSASRREENIEIADYDGVVDEYHQDVEDEDEVQILESYEMLQMDEIHSQHSNNQHTGDNEVLGEDSSSATDNMLYDDASQLTHIDLMEEMIPANVTNRHRLRRHSFILHDDNGEDLSKTASTTSAPNEYIEEALILEEEGNNEYSNIEYSLDETNFDNEDDDYGTISNSSMANPRSVDVSDEPEDMDSEEGNSEQASLSILRSEMEDTIEESTVDEGEAEEYIVDTLEPYGALETGSNLLRVNNCDQNNECDKKPSNNLSAKEAKVDTNKKTKFKGPRRYMLFDDLIACVVDLDPDGTPMVEFSMPDAARDDDLPIECGICPDVMPRSKLSKHLKTHLVPGTNRYQCIYCEDTYKDSKYLAGHARRHMGIRPYVCELCKLYFSTKQDMRVHNQRRHQEKEHICEMCGKTFAQNTQLKRHREATHEKMRRFKCEHCPKSYYKNFSLQEHIRAVHMGKRRMIICPFCGMQCLDAHKMARHRKQMHLHQKYYECAVCNEGFTDINYFDAHKRSIQCRNNTRRKREEEEALLQHHTIDGELGEDKGEAEQSAQQELNMEMVNCIDEEKDGDDPHKVVSNTRNSKKSSAVYTASKNKSLRAAIDDEDDSDRKLPTKKQMNSTATDVGESITTPARKTAAKNKKELNQSARGARKKLTPGRPRKVKGQKQPEFLLESGIVNNGVEELVQITEADVTSEMDILLEEDLEALDAVSEQMENKSSVLERNITTCDDKQHENVQNLIHAVMLDYNEEEQNNLLDAKPVLTLDQFQGYSTTGGQLVEVIPDDMEDGDLVYEIMIDNNEM